MINLIVAGGGEGFYKKLYPALQTNDLKDEMRIAMLIDILSRDNLNPATISIVEKEHVEYVQVPHDLANLDPISRMASSGSCAGIVMTPNDSHLYYADLFAKCQTPVYVEKPAVTSIEGLDEFLKLAGQYSRLIYAAEYCTEGKALGLLWADGAIPAKDPRRQYLDYEYGVSYANVREAFGSLGRLVTIRGVMLEGSGTRATADHRPWLLEGAHGGMIRDLSSHLFGPLYDLGFAAGDVAFESVILGKYEVGIDFGKYRPLKDASEGETYAKIRGKFFAPRGSIPFTFAVGKYQPERRLLALDFEYGTVRMSYESPFETTINSGAGGQMIRITNSHPEYQALALMDFKQFIEGKTDGHIGRAAAIVRFNESAREFGLKQLGLI